MSHYKLFTTFKNIYEFPYLFTGLDLDEYEKKTSCLLLTLMFEFIVTSVKGREDCCVVLAGSSD